MIRKKTSFRWVLALLLVLSTVLAACGSGTQAPAPASGSSAAPATPAPAPGAKVKDTFNFGINREPDNFDPPMQDGNPNIWTFLNVYQTLIKLKADGSGFEPDLATSWEPSADGLSWTFHLRQDAKFSNGTPVTAKDVVWSLTRANTDKSPWSWSLAEVKDVTAKDDYTVVITLKEKTAPFLSDISLFSNAVLSKDFFDGKPADFIANNMMGSGPYMMTEWKKGEYITLKANPNYYEKGEPKTPNVKLVYIPDDNTRIVKLQSGELDGIDQPPFNRVAELKSNPQMDMQLNPSTAVAHLAFNIRSGPLANKDFRQALSYATDKQGIIKAVLFGNGTPATTFLPGTTLYFDKSNPGYTFDMAKAKAAMAKSGVPAGTKLTILYPAGNAVREQTAAVVKDAWTQLGLNVVLNPMDSATANANYKKDDFEIFVTGWTNDIPDPSELASYELGYTQSESYHTGYKSDQMNQLLASGLTEMDAAKRADIYKQIQTIATDEAMCDWLYYAPYTLTLNKKVTGFVQTTIGNWVFKDVVVNQ